ncbi:MAG: hypothetical protein ACE5JG_04105 [Planctomycetota bacterium]
METPPVGSLVVPAPEYRSAMGTGEGAALLVALRRGSGQLYYPAPGRMFWVSMRQVRRIPPEAVSAGCREAFLSELMLSLQAEECTVEEEGPDALELGVDVPGTSDRELAALTGRLGPRLESYRIAPRGLHAVTLHLRLVSLPEPDSRGT